MREIKPPPDALPTLISTPTVEEPRGRSLQKLFAESRARTRSPLPPPPPTLALQKEVERERRVRSKSDGGALLKSFVPARDVDMPALKRVHAHQKTESAGAVVRSNSKGSMRDLKRTSVKSKDSMQDIRDAHSDVEVASISSKKTASTSLSRTIYRTPSLPQMSDAGSIHSMQERQRKNSAVLLKKMPKKTQVSDISLYQVLKEEPETVENVYSPPPENVRELRPFWIIQLLEQSISNGGYITANLYIPKCVWQMKSVRLQSLEVKTAQCDRVREALEHMTRLELDELGKIQKELEAFDALLNNARNTLAKKLPFIKETQKKKVLNVMGGFSKGVERIQASYTKDKSGDLLTEYVETLARLFRASLLLDQWYRHFASGQSFSPLSPSLLQSNGLSPTVYAFPKKPMSPTTNRRPSNDVVLDKIVKSGEFFQNVVCTFVLRDLGHLYGAYIKSTRDWMTE
jgi:hypothetical protein